MYQSYYNLTGKPFRLSPDPGFFFPSRGHKRALAYLRYGLHQNEGFVVITGAPGTGKTTLAQILLDEMGQKNVVVAHLTTTQLEADDMLRMVAASFGLRYENLDKAALLKTIESFLLARSREGKRALLVIDEAQNLPARSLEELRMLSNLYVGDNALLQTFLLGQVQFRKMLEDPELEQLRQRVIANFHLSPLAQDESQRYIESRLRHVGWDNDPHFAEIAFEKIHQYTEGVPRRINMLCDRILLFGCMEEQHNVTGELVDLVRKELEQEVSGVAFETDESESSAETTSVEGQKGEVVESETQFTREASETAAENAHQPEPVEAESTQVASTELTSATLTADDERQQQKSNEPEEEQSLTPAKDLRQRVKAKQQPSRPSQTKPDHKAESGKESQSVANTKAANQDPASNTTGDEQRREPHMPVFDSEDEDFIEITEDFIAAFDQSISVDDDGTDEAEPAVTRPAARKQKQQSAAQAGREASTAAVATSDKDDKEDKPEVARQENEEDQRADTDEEDVLGNTVKHKKVAEAETDNDEVGEVKIVDDDHGKIGPQISERDLFRVIPGGKDSGAKQVDNESPAKQRQAPAASATPSTEDVILRRILRLVLAFHRSPSSFPGLDDPTQPLPEGVSELLELAVSDDQVLTKVSPAAVMGISPVMLRAAVRFFIRRTLFSAKGDHYRVLGLQNNATVADIERHYDLLMRLLRQDKQPGAAECVDKVGHAYEELMRLDNAPTIATSEKSAASTGSKSDNKAAAVLEALENPDLTIDFNQEIKSKPQPQPVAAFLNTGSESYTPDPRITRRRFHLVGQAAILGIGALVIVLAIFITQLEPTETRDSRARSDTVNEQLALAPQAGSPTQESEADQRRRGLSLSDGTPSSDGGASTTTSSSGNASSDSDRSAQGRKSDSGSPNQEKQSPVKEQSPVKVVSASKAEHKSLPEASSRPSARQMTPVPVKSRETATSEIAESENTEPTTSAKSETRTAPTSVPVKEFSPGGSSSVLSSRTQSMQQVPMQSKDDGSASEINSTVVQQSTTTSSSRFQPIAVQEKSATTVSSAPATEMVPSTSASSSTQSDALQNRFEGRDIPLSAASTASSSAASSTAAATSSDTITRDQLTRLLDTYAKAYENGDLNRLMTLFEPSARTNTQTSKKGIESELRDLFSTSASRNIILIPSIWDEEGRFARGVGQFSKTVVPQGGAPTTVKGKYTIQTHLENGQLKISRFYTSNEVVTSKGAPAGGPKPAELQALLSSFTKYYENGEINQLMNLFADNAQTNDQTTLSGIRKDHADLFSTTQKRQMFLKDIQWNVEGNKAIGKGNFEVMVLPKGQDKYASVTGTISVEAIKSGNNVKITKFFHKEQ